MAYNEFAYFYELFFDMIFTLLSCNAKVIILEDFTNVNGFFNLIFILTQFLVFIKDFRHFIFLCNPHILP